eukprot:scaffold6542_cov28-Prasinocladus_malaysianus.AAC.1
MVVQTGQGLIAQNPSVFYGRFDPVHSGTASLVQLRKSCEARKHRPIEEAETSNRGIVQCRQDDNGCGLKSAQRAYSLGLSFRRRRPNSRHRGTARLIAYTSDRAG